MHRMPNTDFLRLDNFTYMLVKSMGEFSLEQTKKKLKKKLALLLR